MLVGYHGTTAQKAKSILASGQFQGSVGDRHWLGDGVYFFSEELHAYIWNRDHYKKHSRSIDVHLLLQKYAVLSAEIQDDRVFDLDKAVHKLLFDEAYTRACNGLEKIPHSNRKVFAEGVILNLMFSRMGFGSDFDLVAATFLIKINRYDGLPLPTQLRGIPQRQVCVKNSHVIHKIAVDDINERVVDLEKQALALQTPHSWNYSSGQKIRYGV